MGTFVHCWWKRQMVQRCGKVWCFFQRLNIELPHAPATPLLGLHPKELKAATQTGICMPMLFTRVTRCEQPKCPSMEEWRNKMGSLHTMQHYSAIARSAGLCYTTDGPWNTMLHEVRATQKDEYRTVPLIQGTQNRQTQRQQVELWLPGAGGRWDGEFLLVTRRKFWDTRWWLLHCM